MSLDPLSSVLVKINVKCLFKLYLGLLKLSEAKTEEPPMHANETTKMNNSQGDGEHKSSQSRSRTLFGQNSILSDRRLGRVKGATESKAENNRPPPRDKAAK